ncbi:MAG: LssY C-terminal domain-containing protein [Propionicimonas sp.]|uniref:LssY C-terminal domain-containing protein n=1 Tax=Propionicimonas sp. TaxID=1955623 RepID=UPI003D133BAF
MDETGRGLMARIDGAFFVLAGLAAVYLAYLTLREGITPGWPMLLVVVFWVLVSYLVLPRVHRILSRVYVPDYFIGRTRTADGLLGDPVNLALMGSADQIHHALRAAGWTRADDLTLASGWHIVTSTLTRRSYPQAPVSPLLLFRRRQDFAYQQEVDGSPFQRHHVRFWKCPDGWFLPGGLRVDWLAAGTYDRSVGLSLFTLQITHKIGADVDVERDHVVATVRDANAAATVRVLPDFFTGYHSRNGGGDLIETDGDLPIIDLTALVAPAESSGPPPDPGRISRPVQTVIGALMTFVRGLVYAALASFALIGTSDADEGTAAASALVAVILGLGALGDLLLAGATFAGHNWSRLLLCASSVLGVGSVITERLVGNLGGPLHEGLLPLATSVLVLLALSSDSAREYALGRRRGRRKVAGGPS